MRDIINIVKENSELLTPIILEARYRPIKKPKMLPHPNRMDFSRLSGSFSKLKFFLFSFRV